MKKVSPELMAYLHSKKEFIICDLYEITLKSGLVFRYAAFDRTIKLQDGRVFSHKGPIFKRTRTKLTSNITVDKMTVTVACNEVDKIGGLPMMQVVHNGGFDEAQLTLYRCFLDHPSNLDEGLLLRFVGDGDAINPQNDLIVIGVIEWFGGYIDVESGGGLEMRWSVKSGVQKLNVEYPLRKYYPSCPYALYDSGCGLKLSDYIATGTITAVNGIRDFNTTIVRDDGYFEQGGIEFTSGALSGVSAPIQASYQANGRIIMLIPLDTSPAVGDTFKIYPGCDKTPEKCRSKFNNFNRNRATPYIPLKETII